MSEEEIFAVWGPLLAAVTLMFGVHSCNETEEYLYGPAGKSYVEAAKHEKDDETTLSPDEAVIFGKAYGECKE